MNQTITRYTKLLAVILLTLVCTTRLVAFDISASNLTSTGTAEPAEKQNVFGNKFIQGINNLNETLKSANFLNTLTINGTLTHPACNNSNTGSITTSVSGGTAPYTYLWSNGRTTKNNVNIAAGTYTVTVTSANGITGTKQFVLINPPVLVAFLNCPVACFNQCNGQATVTVSGGTPGYSYQWSGPSGFTAGNVSTISNLCTGTYTVTVTDSKGCKRITSGVVTQNSQISINQTINEITCNNQCNGKITLSVSGGTAPYTYLWSNGTTKNNIANICAGSYSVTVKDNRGCQATKSFNLINPPAVVVSATANSNCLLLNNCTASVTANVTSGTAPFTYLWSNGATTSAITGLCDAGNFTVTVTDSKGCTASATGIIFPCDPCVNPSISISGPSTWCFSSGAATLTAVGGNSGSIYNWSNGATASSISVTATGTYSVTVINGDCQGTASKTITVKPCCNVTNGGNIGGHLEFCGCVPAGTITLGPGTLPSGGEGTLEYMWLYSDVEDYAFNPGNTWWTPIAGATSSSYTVNYELCNSRWFVRCSRRSGCDTWPGESNVVRVRINPKPSVTVTADANCIKLYNCTASVTANVTSGTAPFSYVWNTGATTSSIGGLCDAGNFSVTVTDAKGCTATGSVTTLPCGNCAALINGPSTHCFSLGAATLTATPAGYSYIWSTGATTQSILVTTSGTYSVTVINETSVCTASKTITVKQCCNVTNGGNIGQNQTFCGCVPAGTVTFGANAPTGGEGALEYMWLYSNTGIYQFQNFNQNWFPIPGATNQTYTVDYELCQTRYFLRCSRRAGCDDWTAGESNRPCIIVNPKPSVTVTADQNCIKLYNCEASVTANVTSGTAPYTYVWNTGATTSSITGICNAGIYTVTVTDSKGCTASATAPLFIPCEPCVNPSISISGPSTWCFSSGAATLTAVGGNSGSIYNWSNGATTSSISVTATGIYSVTVINGDCQGTASKTITVKPCCNVTNGGNIGTHLEFCGCVPAGTITLGPGTLPSGGSGDLEYMWLYSDVEDYAFNPGNTWWTPIAGATSSSYTVNYELCNSRWFVRCSRRSGCNDWPGESNVVRVRINPKPSVTVTADANCIKLYNCTASVTANVTSGTAPFSYVWNTGATTSSIGGLCDAGNFSVTVTDAKGCTATGSVTTLPCGNCAALINGPSTHCFSLGAATLTATPAGYSYIWSTGATTQSISVTTSGTYSVTVINETSVCTASKTITVKQCCNVTNGGNIGQNQTFCGCVPAGTVTFGANAPTGGEGALEYMWLYSNTGIYQFQNFNQNWFPIPGATNQTYTVDYELCQTRYFLRCSRRAGCDDWTAGESNRPCIIVNPKPSVTVEVNSDCIKLYTCTASVTASVTSGTAPFTYIWSNGATTSSIGGLCNAGNFTVTVTDAKGCTATGNGVIAPCTEPCVNPVISISGPSTHCFSSGAATLVANGGSAGSIYAWSTGATTSSISVTATGTYSVTVINAPCQGTASKTITIKPCCNVTNGGNIGTHLEFCGCVPAGTITLGPGTLPSGGEGTLEYMWLYSDVEDYIFYEGETNWNPIPGSSNASYTIDYELCQSRWFLRCSRRAGCNTWPGESNVVRVRINPVPVVGVNVVGSGNCIILSACGASVTANVTSGTAPFTYLWSNGATTSAITGLCDAGNFTVTVTDAKGCTATGNGVIAPCTEPCVNPVISISGPSTHCFSLGAATLVANGGSAGSIYAWSTGATTSSISVTATGTYTVTVTNVTCKGTASKTITVKPCCNVTNGGNIGQDQTFCGCVPAGTVTFGANAPTGGEGALEYMWLYSNTGIYQFQNFNQNWFPIPGATNQTYTVDYELCQTRYFLRCSRRAGCDDWTAGESNRPCIIVNPKPSVTVEVNSDCIKLYTCTASVTASVTSGTAPFTYIWSNGATTSSIGGLCNAGNFTVTVTDAKGCTATGNGVIAPCTEPCVNPVISISGPSTHCFSSGAATLVANGGSAGSIYAWSTGATTSSISVTATGTYSVTVINAPCQGTASKTITIKPCCNVTNGGNIGTHLEFCGCVPAGTITLGPGTLPSGGEGTLEYMWLYSDVEDYIFYEGETNWNPIPGSSNASYTIDYELCQSRWFLRCSRRAGCNTWPGESNVVRVRINPVPVVGVNVVGSGNCIILSACGASVTANVTSGTAPFTYLWSNGATTSAITGLCDAGNFTVTVTDAKGCTATGNGVIAPCTEPCVNPVISISGPSTHCFSLGAATLVVNGGSAGSIYAWSTGATTSSISVTATGTYTVTVTNVTCKGTASKTITVKPCCNVTNGGNIGQDQTFCGCVPAGTVTFGANAPTGGEGALEYMWLYSNTGIYQFQNFNQNWFPIPGATNQTYTVDYELCQTRYFLRCSRRAGCDDWTAGESNRPCIIVNPKPSVTVEVNSDCIKLYTCTASVTASVTSGTAPFTYIWSNGATTSSIGGLCNAGNFTVTVTDAKGCTATGNGVIAPCTEPCVNPVISISGPSTHCFSSGAATLVANGGSAGSIYAWSTGATTSSISVTATGTYSVTVINAPCQGTASKTITIKPCCNVTNGGNIGTHLEFCGCVPAGTITLGPGTLPSGGEGTLEYMWLYSDVEDYIFYEGETNWNPIPGSSNASYTIDYELCQSRWFLRCSRRAGCNTWPGESNVVRVRINPVPVVGVNVVGSGNCIILSACGASVTANVTSGTAPFTYLWSNGATTSAITGLCDAGNFTVTVTDAKGCTATGNGVIAPCTEPCVNPVISISGPSTHCFSLGAATLVANGGSAGSIYAWSTGATTSSISVTATGTYTVTVTNVTCKGTASKTITVKPCCNVTNGGNIGQDQTFCGCVPAGTVTFGANAPTGGEGALEYMWLYSNTGIYQFQNFNQNWFPIPGATNQTYTVDYELCQTRYFLRCSRRAGCDDWTAGESNRPCIIVNPKPSVTVEVNSDCIKLYTCTASVTASVTSGTAPFTYIWSNGATTSSIGGLCNAGNFTVTVTDAKGCTATGNGVIAPCTEPCVNPVISISGPSTHCFSSGAATLVANGGSAGSIYAWSTGATTSSISVTATGTYSVTVINAPCQGTASKTVTVKQCCNVTNGGNIGGHLEFCGCVPAGTITLGPGTLPSGGEGALEYMWLYSDVEDYAFNPGNTWWTPIAGASNASYTVDYELCNSRWFVRCSRRSGCNDWPGESNVVRVRVKPVPVVTLASSIVACAGPCTGSISIGVSGVPSYSVIWTKDGAPFASNVNALDNLCTGQYCFTVDANGCTVSDCFSVNSPDFLEASVSSTEPTCSKLNAPAGCDGTATVTITGGSAPYTVEWDNGDEGETIVNLCGGTFKYTVTDANGCVVTGLVDITEPEPFFASSECACNAAGLLCKGDCNAAFNLTVLGRFTPELSFAWSNGATTQNVDGLCAGEYDVTITDANGCQDVHTVQPVTEPTDYLTAEPIEITADDCSEASTACDGEATVIVSGGTAPYSYEWSTGDETESISGLCLGDYVVTVTDINGCIVVAEVRIGCSADAEARNAEADATSNLTSNGQPQIVVYPNPMSEKANIDFITPADELVTLEVFNVTGVKVAELFRGQVKGGVKQSVLFNNDNYAEGMYIYRLTTSEGSFTGNIVIVR